MRTELFPDQNTYGEAEKQAIERVLKRGRLSYYRGTDCDEFYGGPEIRNLEKKWSDKWGSKHSICCNSATSGLHIACGAIGLQPGDEVIVTPWSMTCSATAPLMYGAIPIFADIEKDYFCLDVKSIEERITSRTKAIIVVDLFGQPYDQKINELAKKHNLYVIEDAAQAPGSTYKDKCAGTFGHIGVFSFNYGKHINCGEGGMIVTDDDVLAERCRLIMNHAESVMNDREHKYKSLMSVVLPNNELLGFNMRMTEIQAAIISAQLDKFDHLLNQRMVNAHFLSYELTKIDGIEKAAWRKDCTHTYYALPFLFKDLYSLQYLEKNKIKNKLYSMPFCGKKRNRYIEKVKMLLTPRKERDNEGVQIGCGYIKPLYLMPFFQERKHWAFSLSDNMKMNHDQGMGEHGLDSSHMVKNYKQGSCPNAEKLWKEDLFLTLYHAPNSTIKDMERVATAFKEAQ